MTLSTPSTAPRNRGTPVTEDAERQPDGERRDERSAGEGDVPRRLVRESRGVDRIFAHDRQMVEGAVRERQPRDRERDDQEKHPQRRPGAHACRGVGREEPQGDIDAPTRPPRERYAPPGCPAG